MIEKNDKMDLGYYSNALWVIVVTMYTSSFKILILLKRL